MHTKKFIPAKRLKYLYYRIVALWSYFLELIIPPDKVDYRNIPIIINNFNRFDTLKRLISSLESRGYKNIVIIDNNSTNPKLSDFYKTCGYKIYRFERNLGSAALWESEVFKEYRRNYFVYTDPDMVPVDECPADFMRFFFDVLRKHKFAQKVGFSLKIDDLPDHYLHKQHVLDYEGQFYDYFIEEESLYRAPVATTFALYRPRALKKHANNYIEMYRTAYPYMALHLPWYQDSLNPDEDERYYLEHLEKGYWYSTKNKKTLEKGRI
ncbi:MAG TPA: glycosyltransferase [Bacteroidales bacterium]|nr:glycosyltransferase [Bacteroidales bacterium]